MTFGIVWGFATSAGLWVKVQDAQYLSTSDLVNSEYPKLIQHDLALHRGPCIGIQSRMLGLFYRYLEGHGDLVK